MDLSSVKDPAFLRAQMIGADARIRTPFGTRLMVYADYTASGRCLGFVERYLQNLQRIYANTHTEDDISGRSMTHLLHQAEQHIKRSVNAGRHGRIIATGTGATGAIDKFQQILGVALSPATRQRLETLMAQSLGPDALQQYRQTLGEQQPVVFVGPYEHHSNEISWRQSLATVVEVALDDSGGVDLEHLEALLQDPQYRARMKIGSFSAASNVTGMRTPVHAIARTLHRHGGIACFDYAASAPYVLIDMNPEGDEAAALDAIFISPHKFLGGPGSSGVLVFNEKLYPSQLPPTVSAGGTVEYVSLKDQDYIEHIEEREKPGTPGVLQTLKASMAFQIKDALGAEQIEQREQAMLGETFRRWSSDGRIRILGNQDPARRIGIVSFNINYDADSVLHPKFVTTLINDLFGIQSRAGCSCAGPYGHRLLDIDDERSERFRHWIREGYSGIKPGWCRISLHYAMDELEFRYILDAIDFVAEYGADFLPLYSFDLCTGAWLHREDPVQLDDFALENALRCSGECMTVLDEAERATQYRSALAEAEERALALRAGGPVRMARLQGELGDLQFFPLPEACLETPAQTSSGDRA
ncbi:MAG: aminotransferase class V-fold PLP-dependent enzyme [Xanthomonadales bacterium]|nr:aminotransferase class V-fold PLP-dependent enzyme [Xanthomonadales bacterium]